MARRTAAVVSLPAPHGASFAEEWRAFERAMRAEGKSPKTVATYGDTKRAYLAWAGPRGVPTEPIAIRREHVETYIAELIEKHAAENTVLHRFRVLSRFFSWLVAEDAISVSPLEKMRAPKVRNDKPPHILTTTEIDAVLRACEGTSFADRRDMAIVRLLLDKGCGAASLPESK